MLRLPGSIEITLRLKTATGAASQRKLAVGRNKRFLLSVIADREDVRAL